MAFGDAEFPGLREDASRAVAYNRSARRLLQVDLIRKRRMDFIRDVWKVLKRNRARAARKRDLQRNMMLEFKK